MSVFFQDKKTNDEIIEIISTNCYKMLVERGLFEFKDEVLKNFITHMKNKAQFTFDNNIEVYYFTELNSNNNIINNVIHNKNKLHRILILSDNFSVSTKSDSNLIEIFKTSELMLNLIDFKYCPKVKLLTQEEKEKVLKDYNVTVNQLPQFSPTDPLVRYYNGHSGDIFKIFRNSPISGIAIAYRYVI